MIESHKPSMAERLIEFQKAHKSKSAIVLTPSVKSYASYMPGAAVKTSAPSVSVPLAQRLMQQMQSVQPQASRVVQTTSGRAPITQSFGKPKPNLVTPPSAAPAFKIGAKPFTASVTAFATASAVTSSTRSFSPTRSKNEVTPVRGLHGLQVQPDLFKAPPKTPKKKTSKPKTVKSKADVTAKALKSLDLDSVSKMLLCVPSAYSDCRQPLVSVTDLEDGSRGLFWLKRTGVVEALDKHKRRVNVAPYASIFEAPYQGYWSQTVQLRIQLVDEEGAILWLAIFGAWRMKGSDPHGFMLVEGEIKQFGDKRYLTNTNEPPPEVAGEVWVRYACPGAPSETVVRDLIKEALLDEESMDEAAYSLVTTSLLSEVQLLTIAEHACGRSYASLRAFFTALHLPESPEEGVLATTAARAMAVAGICNAAKAGNFRAPSAKAPINLTASSIERLVASQSETLTTDQAAAIRGVVGALRAPHPLNGLLSGDVGTGKTLVFMIPAVAAQMAGAFVAIISPTEILANQVAANLARRFPQIPVERVRAGGKIKNLQAILVGTSGLGSVARKAGYVPNFLVIDEQHKLSTKDRNSMVGPWTHQLEASATPIPRSLASTMFSGMQVFNLTQAPVKRNIESFLLDDSSRGQAVTWMKDSLDAQHRVAVIYPRVEKVMAASVQAASSEYGNEYGSEYGNEYGMGSERHSSQIDASLASVQAADHEYGNEWGMEPDSHSFQADASPVAPVAVVNSVNAAAEALMLRFPGRVGKLHGKMSSEEVVRTLDNFRSGIQPLVVASTIMETGIDIPDIRLLIVKDAENFGAAQLHQLRGRLARNGGSARFVMMVSDKALLSPETAERLNTVRVVSDGFALAEADMVSRGFGDLAGDTQSGNISCAFRLIKLSLDDFEVASRG